MAFLWGWAICCLGTKFFWGAPFHSRWENLSLRVQHTVTHRLSTLRSPLPKQTFPKPPTTTTSLPLLTPLPPNLFYRPLQRPSFHPLISSLNPPLMYTLPTHKDHYCRYFADLSPPSFVSVPPRMGREEEVKRALYRNPNFPIPPGALHSTSTRPKFSFEPSTAP